MMGIILNCYSNLFCKNRNLLVLFLLVIAFAIRIYAGTRPHYIYDEVKWVDLAEQCSVENGKVRLVCHGYQHPFLPAYLIKLSSIIFGKGFLGYRMLNILAGVLMIWVGYVIALKWLGIRQAILAMIFFAFNEYHIAISSFAVEKSFYKLFVILAIYFFYCGISENKKGGIYLSGIFSGLAFLCKEIAGVLPIVFFLYLLFSKFRYYFKRKETYYAFLLFIIIISPDIYWNYRNTASEDGYINYADHLNRVSNVGFSLYPLAFYFGDFFKTFLVKWGLWHDPSVEYPAQNIIWGVLCLGGVILSLKDYRHVFKRLLLCAFLFVFIPLTFLKWKAHPHFEIGLDRIEWFWCSITLIPSILLATDRIAQIKNTHKRIYFLVIALVTLAVIKSFLFLGKWMDNIIPF